MEEGTERGCMKLARLSSMFSSTPDPRHWAGRAKRGEADERGLMMIEYSVG